ncbi:MAG: DUF4339 domain-containing protein [Prevotella sp.]|jgi:hypothetical protein|nr:DUF4339 domain-containing protein [Prevotella sp.]
MEKQYYIASGKDHLGPFTLSQMKDKKLLSETLIWYEGLEQWTKAGDLEELKEGIPVIVSPPLTPTQVETVGKRVKELVLRKQLGKSARYAGIVFLIVFVLYGIVQYIALDKQEITESSYNMYSGRTQYQTYRMSTEDIISTAATSALMMAFIISLVSLPVFYFIEKQKPYKNLLACKDKTKDNIYQGLIRNQEEKYIYDKKLSSAPFIIGCIILGLNFLFGIFPEYKVFIEEVNGQQALFLFLISLAVRIVVAITVYQMLENRNKSRLTLWVIFALILPAIALMIAGSLYPIRIENTDKEVDKGEGYLSASNGVEETQESHKEKAN